MRPRGIRTYDIGHGLTLLRDENTDCFENGWAVAETLDLPDTASYDNWWRCIPCLPVDARLLAVLVERFAGVQITLSGE